MGLWQPVVRGGGRRSIRMSSRPDTEGHPSHRCPTTVQATLGELLHDRVDQRVAEDYRPVLGEPDAAPPSGSLFSAQCRTRPMPTVSDLARRTLADASPVDEAEHDRITR